MSKIIFENKIENKILYDFLKIYCNLENNYYVIDKIIYKKYEYNNQIQTFYDKIKLSYKPSKKFYLEREINFNNLLTIIRQICKYNKIEYYNKIKYDKNNYYIIYYIKNME